ncbi:hypothetical protein [Candidatus Enterococcus clewellii]|uniref:Uncharacterized protein n=1 Tax=Candidatus Enterococcus clewellii TaxID=1834193 RepID=A0A242KCL2_9ENTE|nr:hypothetical protein [Enterococcus sp. 9E7_DIV0242]OTP18809.1 hypothetical protein A5888_000623 [Enterococcus sp. 9E7_DIV0242]
MTKQEKPMLHKVLGSTEKLIEATSGIEITLPKPSKRSMRMSATTNSIIGVGLVAYGLLSPHKWTLILGAASIAGAVVSHNESKNCD